MSILITGAAGFVGSNITKRLNNMGCYDIYLVDSINEKNEKNLKDVKYKDLINKEFFDASTLEKLKEVKVIFHQGAITDTTFNDESEMMRVNYDLSVTIFNHCAFNNCSMIYASSAAVYGTGDNGFVEKNSCENPLNVYAESKLKFDNYVRSSKATNQVVGLRYFNVFGKNEDHKLKMASPINQFYRQAKSIEKVKVFKGSQNYKRDFICVDDVVDVNMFFYENKNISGIFNCGTGRTATFQDAAELVSSQLNVPIEEIPFPDILKGKYQSYTCADLTSLRSVGYKKEFTSFKDAAFDYIDFMKISE
jgi:ADP-L-glycero-D-manno-heptose 6-epimerase